MGDTGFLRRGRLSTGAKLIWRAVRHDPAVVLSLVAVVVVTSTVMTATPRLLSRVSGEGLRATVAEAPPVLRNVSLGRASRISESAEADPFESVATIGHRFVEDEMPESLQRLIAAETFVVASPRFTVGPMPGDPEWDSRLDTLAHFRYQHDIAEKIDLLAGSLPQPRDPIEVEFPPAEPPSGSIEDEEPPEPEIELLELIEVALGQPALQELGLALGDRILITPDRTHRNHEVAPPHRLAYRIVVEVVGIIGAADPADAYWYDDLSLVQPRVFANPDFSVVTTSMLISPDVYGGLLRDTNGALWDYTWRYFVDPDLLDPATVADLASDVGDLTFRYRSTQLISLGHDRLTTGLDRLIGAYFEQRRSMVAALSLSMVGLLAISLAVVGLLAALIAGRRAEATHLLRSRGASPQQVTVAVAIEALALSIPAAAAGFLLAVVLVPDQPRAPAWQFAAAVALAAALVVVIGAQGPIRRRLATTRDGDTLHPGSLRRVVAEVVVMVTAALSFVLLRRRGLDSPATSSPFDPLLAATPTLLALAAGILVLRFHVLPLRLLSRFGAAGRGLVPFVGMRRILQQAPAGRLPLLVLTVAATLSTLAGSFQLSIDKGQEAAAWHAVGADYRISHADATTPLPRSLNHAAIDSIEAAAAEFRVEAPLRAPPASTSSVDLLAIEVAEYSKVVRSTPARVPAGFETIRTPVRSDVGTDASPIPAFVSSALANRFDLAAGDRFALNLGPTEASFTVADVIDRFPTMAPDRPFVVADFAGIQQLGSDPRSPTAIYLRAPPSTATEIADLLARQARPLHLHDRVATYRSLSETPLVSAVSRGMRLAFIGGGAFAVLAALVGFTLTSRARMQHVAQLRTMGLTSRQATAITVIEQLPPALLSVLAGGLLGTGMAVVFEPSVGLAPFTGPGLPVAVEKDLVGVGLIIVAVSVAVLAATRWFAAGSRRASLGGVLRLGNE